MQRQLQQMVRLVDDLLDVSRITTGKLAVRKTHVDVRDAVREAVETVQPFLESRHHALEVSIAPEPLEVDGDAARLSQVFGNLLHNAAKYTEPGGHLAISASHEDGNVVVRVKDDGIGLDPSALASIFEMFVQVDRSLTRAQAGLGVGLTLARRLVSLHGGTVTAYSGGLGHGTELIVRLPAADAVGTHAPGFPGHVPKRVLLADDNIEFAAGIAEAIENAGHEVRIAHDGAQALLEAQEFKPDIAFLDIGMPKVHGYEVARRLREDPSLRGITLVALTGWGHADDRDRAREAGFDRHLVKPVEAVDVLALVEESAPRPNVA